MRHLLKILFFLIFILKIVVYSFAADSDIDIIKKRVFDSLIEFPVDDEVIAKLVETILEDGTWPDIDYKDLSNEGFQHSRHSANLVRLGRAYNTKTSKYFKSKKVKSVIESALKNWVEHDYICGNWWNNEIGTPGDLVNLMLLVGNTLPKDLVEKAQPIIGRAHIEGPGARPGGDRIKIASIQAKNMLFTGDTEIFEKVVDVIENEIKFVDWIGKKFGYTYWFYQAGFANRGYGGRGIQYGNSFHHRIDGVNNTLSYGLGYANSFVEWAVYTSETKYAFSDEKLSRLVDYYLDGICKTAVFGKYPDPGAANRDVSRRGALRPFGSKVVENLLLTTNYRKGELIEIAEIRSKGIKPTLSHSTFFWNTEHFSYQRPDWFVSVRMYSTRTHNMEEPYNSEGLLNHHRGDGANHISRTGNEYYNIYPVFDYQKVPGATIMQKSELPAPREIKKIGLTDFVGAVTDGKYGTVAFDFKSPHDPLIARKSWFFFDDEYVCLGAGISCKQQNSVVTAINQCLLRGDVVCYAEQKKTNIPAGENKIESVDWIFHDNIGYVFPEPTEIRLKNNAATGSWWDINKQTSSPKDLISMDVFKLWVEHGNRPSEEKYEYIVVPATSVEILEQNKSKNNIEILSNTEELQAVKNKELDICQIVFYKGGEIEIDDNLKLISDNPGVIMTKLVNGKITEISLSDPNRELIKFNFSVSQKIESEGDNYISFWDDKQKMTQISVQLPIGNYEGDSVTIKL